MHSSSAPPSCQISDYVPEDSRLELIYENLSTVGGEFRLLQIEAAKDYTAQIIARLFKTSLNDHPAYEAVSYRWEQTNHAHFIVVNGFEVPVMGNVFSMLSEFRCQAFPASPIFWVDSICVNQSCTQDRNEQVQLMGKIYSKASLVRIWIGTEYDHADQAFELVCNCGPANEISEERVAWNVIHDEAGTKALTKLLQRDYWNRMWVFQEIVLAKEAVVHCGKLQAPWSNFRWLDVVSSKHTLWLTAQVEYPWIFEFRKALFTIAHFCVTSAEASHVNNVLHPTRHLRCQDPRDKLYALRGVCEAMTRTVKVNYSAPVRDVFTTFARNQILADVNLSSLLTAGLWSPLNGDDINLPSWAPDLRGMGGVDIRYLAGHQTNYFNADGGTNSRHRLSTPVNRRSFLEKDGFSILSIQAILFDYIQCCTPLQGMAHSATDRKELINSFCLLDVDDMSSMKRLRQLFEGLIFGDKSTLMTNTSTERHIEERARRLVLGFYEDLCQLFGPKPVFTDFLETFECITPHGFKPLQEEVQLCDVDVLHLNRMEYLRRAAETTDQQAAARALFLTIDGNLGIGPRVVQQDDVVVLVGGCGVPLVLRQYPLYYRLVGPAYVSGIMQGETLSSMDLSLEKFEII